MITSLREALFKIGHEFSDAKSESFSGHPLAGYIRQDLRQYVETLLGPFSSTMTVKGSAGAGNWAEIPWVAVFDPLVTNSATRGYYVVYLFSTDRVYLSLNQGATAVIEEFGGQARQVLAERATLMRARLKDFSIRYHTTEIELASALALPQAYMAGHALGLNYNLNNLPDDDILKDDLSNLLKAYSTLTFRGGLDPSLELENGIQDESAEMVLPSATLTEIRQYRLHRKIDRHPEAAKKAKKCHGYVCQACDFDFEKTYGSLGKQYIEAHHLRPLKSLEEGIPVSYNIATDFAVLCANCHRMIHRQTDPSDLSKLVAILNERRSPND